MGFISRQPTPNEPDKATWNYGPQPPWSNFSAILNGKARRCKVCNRVTMRQFLTAGVCPECNAPQPGGAALMGERELRIIEPPYPGGAAADAGRVAESN